MRATHLKRTNLILLIIVGLILTGCAMSYQPINAPKLKYNVTDNQNGIELSYKYDVLQLKGNKKYAKSEDRIGVKLVAVKIVNNTDTTINLGTNTMIYAGNKPIDILTPYIFQNSIKQKSMAYLPYALFTFLNFNISNGSYYSQSIPVGYVLGPLLTFGNIIVASNANKNLLKELIEYDLRNKDIRKGETVYGLIGIDQGEFMPLTIRKMK